MTQEPTFLFCVGATKAGTSWLHDHLSGHDDCYFRSIKELHYFGLSDPVDVDTALHKTTKEIARITDQPTKFQGQNAMKQRRLADLRDWQAVLQKPLADLSAYRAYLTDGMANAKVVGDVTPGYALLPESRLKAMLDVGKNVRILYLIRDPLARLWSHVRMIVSNVPPEKFKSEAVALFDLIISAGRSASADGIVARGDYASILPKLTRVFGPKRLMVMFYEDLFSEAGIEKLSRFLGVAPRQTDLNRRVHQGEPLALPSALRDRALAYLRPQYDYIANTIGDMPKSWQHNMKEGIA